MLNRKSRAVLEKTIASAAATYTANDQVGALVQLSNAFDLESGVGEVVSLTVIDQAAQTIAMDVFLFHTAPTLTSSDQDAVGITDAILSATCLGVISVAAGDWKAAGSGATVATVKDIGMMVKCAKGNASSGNTSLWALVVTRGTPTFVANGLKLLLGIER